MFRKKEDKQRIIRLDVSMYYANETVHLFFTREQKTVSNK